MRANNRQPNERRQEGERTTARQARAEGGRGDLSEATTTNRGTERAKVHPDRQARAERGESRESHRTMARRVELEGAVAKQRTEGSRTADVALTARARRGIHGPSNKRMQLTKPGELRSFAADPPCWADLIGSSTERVYRAWTRRQTARPDEARCNAPQLGPFS